MTKEKIMLIIEEEFKGVFDFSMTGDVTVFEYELDDVMENIKRRLIMEWK